MHFVLVYLERIQYIQRGGGGEMNHRSAKEYHKIVQSQNSGTQQKHLEIYYHSDRPRSDYLYKMISFQLNILSQLIKNLFLLDDFIGFIR